jgi:NAD(P)H-hydrate epimerase
MRVLNIAQMREADRRTIEEVGLPSAVLMENAGRQVVAAMERHLPALADWRVAVVCGIGNNGGDGCVVARALEACGVSTRVYLLASASTIEGDARVNLTALDAVGVPVVDVSDPDGWASYLSEIGAADVVVDALFGTGLARPLEGRWQTVVRDLNACGVPIVSVDLPSGLSADTTRPIGETIDASLTVTLGAPKLPLMMPPAANLAGDVVVADIGIPDGVIEGLTGPRVEVITSDRLRELVVPRPDEFHKGDCGRVLLVAGSTGKTGAAQLAALGALRSGAGLVTVATPRACQAVVGSLMPEYMTIGLADTAEGMVAAEAADTILAERCDVLVVGPGLGQGAGARRLVRALVERATTPLVLDADGLNAFAAADDDAAGLVGRDGRDLIITPHPGEMARLTGASIEHVQAHRIVVARELARTRQIHVVLKGARTVVATPEGTVLINVTGNPGMATGGTGDVLAGVLGAWLAQVLDAQAACALGVFLHGLAGDLAAAEQGEVAMIASDLADNLGPAVRKLMSDDRDDTEWPSAT